MKRIIFILCFALVWQQGFAYAPNYEAYKIYLRGVLEHKAGAFDAAQKDYEKAVALDPAALAVYKDLLYLYWQTGNNQKAFSSAEKIEELDGANPQTTIFLSTFYLIANQPVKAKALWDKTLELEPDNETATVYLAAYYYSDNDLEQSALYWNKFLQQQPDSAAGYFQLALVQERLDMTKEALKSYDKVIELKPEAKEAYLSKARIYENTKDFPLAIAEYEKYVEVFPDNLYALMYLGRCYYENNEYSKAAAAFLKAKKGLQGADLEMTSYWLGVLYEKMGKLDKAADEFEFLSLKQPENIAVIARLGYYYSLLKQYSKADKKFQSATEKEPLNYEVSYLQGLNYIDWEKYDKAAKSFEKSATLKPDFADAYYFLGNAMDKSGDFESAERAFLQAIEINPDHTRAMNYLGYTYADKNVKLAEAELLLTKAVELEPQNGAYLDSLGWLYYRQSKYELAEKFIIKAANITMDPVIYEHLGDVCVELEKLNDAWIAYALSYDAGAQKSAKKKLDLVQKKLSEQDFYNASLFRADSNYKKIFSLKAGYKMKIGSGIYNVKGYVPFNYVKGEGISIGVPVKFFIGGASIYIKDGNISFEPKAVANEIPQEFAGLVSFAAEIFSPGFFKQFENVPVIRKGKKLVYSADAAKLVLNSETGLVEKIEKDGLTVEPAKFKRFLSGKIPYEIKVSSKKYKFKCLFEAVSVSSADKHIKNPDGKAASGDNERDEEIKNENNDTGSGKN